MGEKRSLAVLVTLLSAIAFSTKAIFAKCAYQYGVEPIALLTIRMILAAPFFAVALLLVPAKDHVAIPGKDHFGIWLIGGSWILSFWSA